MSKLELLIKVIVASSVIGVSGVSANPESGSQLIQNMNRDALIANPATLQNTNAQVTSVSQFSDVQPTDWAFTALQSLVERYGVIAGYPNGTFRGSRALSRYEFAAGLNSALDKINELISEGLSDKVSKEDLATLQKLQEEFSAELAVLKGRVTALEAKTATLEAQQFSTTTKLTGSVIFGAAGAFGNNTATETSRNITLAARVRLNLNTSFTGKDLLFTRLQATNVGNNTVNAPGFSNNLTNLSFGGGAGGGNTFAIERLYYRFPVADQVNVLVGTTINIDNILNNVNPDLASNETGSISRFGDRDPLVFRGQGDQGGGVGVQIKFNDQFAFNAAYLANNPSNPTSTGISGDAGLFGGGYSASAQLLFTPIKDLTLGFVYQRAYDPAPTALSVNSGTLATVNPFGNLGVGASSDRFGLQTNFNLSPNLSFNGRVSYVTARAVSGGDTADILSWLTAVTFKDLFVQGNQATIAFGQPPYIIGGTVKNASGFQSPYHLEAFYRFQLNRNISVTPGLITIFNPLSTGTASNDPVFIGVLRTSFVF